MWHVSSCSGVATLRTAIHLLLTYLQTHRQTDREPNFIVQRWSSNGNHWMSMAHAEMKSPSGIHNPRLPSQPHGITTPRPVRRHPRPTVTFPAAGGDEESEWNPRDCAGRVDDRVGRKLAVDVLVRAARHTHDAKSSIYRLNKHRDK